MNSVAPRLGILLLALVLVTGVCELVARAVFPAPGELGREPQIVYLSDPEIGYVHAPNQQGWIDSGRVTINSLGFRGPETVVPKPADLYRIVVIGDSLTLGMGVGEDETYGARLVELLRAGLPDHRIDVVNLGVSGYNTRQALGLLKRHLAALEPDLVLLGFYTNDVSGALEATRSAREERTDTEGAEPRPRQVLRMTPSDAWPFKSWLRRSRAAYIAGRALTRLLRRGEWASAAYAAEVDLLAGRTSPELEKAWLIVEGHLREFKTISTAVGFSAGIVILPNRLQVAREYDGLSYQGRLLKLSRAIGLSAVDPLTTLQAADQGAGDLFLPYDIHHPTAAGHHLIAQAAYEQAVATLVRNDVRRRGGSAPDKSR